MMDYRSFILVRMEISKCKLKLDVYYDYFNAAEIQEDAYSFLDWNSVFVYEVRCPIAVFRKNFWVYSFMQITVSYTSKDIRR